MGFKKVYKALQEIFPEVDSRILRAVAIEHCKDGDTAVEVVLNEVIPCLTKLPSTSAEHSGVTGISSAAAVDANRPPQPDAFLLHNTKDSDELQNGSSFYDAGCGHHQTIEDTDGESLQNYHDAVGGDHIPLEVGGGTPVSVEKCDKDPEATSFTVNKKNGAEVADNKLCLPTECVVLHDTFEGTENSSSDDSTALVHKRIHEEVSSQDNEDMKDPESQVVPLSAQTLCGSEDSIEFVVAPDVHNFELEKTEISLHQKEKTELSDSIDATSSEDLAGVILVTKEESMPNSVVTASGQICSIDLLEDMMTEAKSNKKTLFLAVESIICLMRDVELQEEAAEQAKLEAAKGGLDMLERVEDLKEMLQHAKEANDMHAGEVYGEKSILATEVKELQSRLLGLADERDKSLAVLDEMRQTLEVRMAAAAKEIKAAEQERLEKKEVARKALADQEIIMEKVVQEANVLKQEAEENAKLRDFLVDRGRVVDTLQGEISVICQDVRLLKEKFDDRVPLRKSLCSGQTSCILASSSSSLKSMISDEVAEPADLLHAPEKVNRVSCHEEEHKVSEDVKSVIHNTDLVDDGWEIFDNRELYV
ncbi:rab11 family-interacting protein 3 isoform X3 [Solanum pennellii]|uniref:Rab11 family-interacting protein 3 isoform X3 n=1 Tax=Solanum pennellii TaxID=28526 RepID=A0ABM1HNP0_SOLPN|nr:rab11 family-interacting protein 3 isoform X3 [Solanum pennellii]